MKYPKLKFRLNQKLDFEMVREFFNYSMGGINFGKDGILKVHPGLKKIDINSDDELKSYINDFYNLNKSLLEKAQDDFEKKWHLVETKFFTECDKIFGKLPWPKGKYIAYVSILNCGPRFLEDKTFQVFYKADKQSNFYIAHEMLHFQFYNYYGKRLLKYKNKDVNKIWELSEVFNSLVMWQDENWKKICDPVKQWSYPEHEGIVKELEPIWQKNKSVNLLFDSYFK